MNKTYKYRLYPTEAQTEKLQWVLDRCRELYNAALSERRDAYKYAGKRVTYYDQQNDLPEIKSEIREEYGEIAAHVLQDVLRRLDKAYKAFFRRVKNGEKPGFPRFQGKNRYDSFCYPDGAGWKLKGNKLRLTKIGTLKIKLHREIVGKIKTVTIKREGKHWYVTLSCEVDAKDFQRTPYTDDAIGIDLGLLHFATLSTGDTLENPRYYRKSEKKLEKTQQTLARKKRGSHRRRKAVQQVARCHRKVRNQRKDFLHKQSRQLVNTYGMIVFEDIKPGNLSRAPKPKQDENGKYLPNGASQKAGLNKSILDAGWSQFIHYCEFKAACAGTVQVVRVDPKYTSQICSGCGQVRKKELSERWHSCECGTELDRDHNAAINILRLGIKAVLGRKGPTEQSVEAPCL